MTSHTRVVSDYSGSGSSPLDLSDPAVTRVYKEIVSGGPTAWEVIGYEGDSDKLVLVNSGTGGLDEVLDELSDGSVQYVFMRVQHPRGTKFVLICWVGDSVPIVRKGMVTKHVHEVESLLKGAHAVIPARSEKDLSEDVINKKLFKAPYALFSTCERHIEHCNRLRTLYAVKSENIHV